MFDFFLKYINPIKIIVLLTLIFGFICLKRKNRVHQYVLWILTISFITEYSVFILLYFKQPIGVLYSISFIFHHSVWLLLLSHFVEHKDRMRIWIGIFIVFAILNIFFFEAIINLNYYTFIFGAFVYLFFFISESFFQLKRDNFTFFTSNNFLLLFSPVFFFLGYSFMFAFQDYNVISVKIFGTIELYDFIGYIVNISYYLLLNYYIFKERSSND